MEHQGCEGSCPGKLFQRQATVPDFGPRQPTLHPCLPQALLSSLGDEWFRITLEGSIYAWICRREDGSEDGFAELSPAPWVHVGAGEVDERPCWINEDTQEFFFLEAGQ